MLYQDCKSSATYSVSNGTVHAEDDETPSEVIPLIMETFSFADDVCCVTCIFADTVSADDPVFCLFTVMQKSHPLFE